MKNRWIVSLFLTFMFIAGIISPAMADGIIIPIPTVCIEGKGCIITPVPHPIYSTLNIKYHHVDVKIENQIAVTHVDQVFYNPNDFPVEGTYIFPLPLDAAVSNFVLWMDGQPVEGKVLSAEEARQTYEDIVRKMRDPALLEYAGRGCVQATIFPIPPHGERKIELKYTQVLTVSNGLVQYVYPLNTEKFSAVPLESVSVSIDITSQEPIRAVYSPTHQVAVTRVDNNHVTVSYEASSVLPDKDFSLFYSLGETEAFHILSYRDPGDPLDTDGFFLLLLAPKPGSDVKVIDKDVLLVLDRSGSMDGEKFRQAQTAVRYILGHLNANDRFYLETFNDQISVFANELRPVSDTSAALEWLDNQSAAGSTDINRALLEAAAVSNRERPTYLIFLTDGLPTTGVKESQQILTNFASGAPSNLRLFAFGVGYDVDTVLLDSLTQDHHGLSSYVKPGEQLDEILSGFYARISTPVLTNLSIDFGSIMTYDLFPQPLPDLFSGDQMVVVGRYQKGGVTNVKLSGQVNGSLQEFSYPEQMFTDDSRGQSGVLDNIPRLWATRKIGYLLNRIRLHGADKETVDQIVRLSIRYGIVTPYTSYLVTEQMPLGAEHQKQLADQTYNGIITAPSAAPSGQAAVEIARDEGTLAGANVSPILPASAENQVKMVGARTFVLSNNTWVDTAFDPDKMKPQIVIFLSDDYFKLAQSRADVAAGLALGDHVIIVVDGVAYEILVDASSAVTIVSPIKMTPVVTEMKPTVISATVTVAHVTATRVLEQRTATPAAVLTQTVPAQSSVSSNIPVGSMVAVGAIIIAVVLIFLLRKK